ncbi:MAG TPA: DsbA family oxidoreductase [Aestuariivirgaceae bacterium]|jgi:predicted DsbA family dithiol-disulfide isomerase
MKQSATPISIDVISDVVCPWCFIGKRRLEKAVAAMSSTPLIVRWRPFQLDPTVPEEGMSRQEYLNRKFGAERVSEIHKPVMAAGAMEGIDFHFDKIERSPNTIAAHRLIQLAHSRDLEEAMVERLFRLYFLEGKDIGDRAVLTNAAADIGLDVKAATSFLESNAAEEDVRNEIETARRIGVTGVPTFIVGNRYAVIGAQEPRYIAGAIAKARADSPAQAESF